MFEREIAWKYSKSTGKELNSRLVENIQGFKRDNDRLGEENVGLRGKVQFLNAKIEKMAAGLRG
jgi:hypothetical protein